MSNVVPLFTPDSSETPVEPADAAFTVFWAQYPRRRAKADAEKAYKGLLKCGMAPETILEAVAALVAEITKEGTAMKYVPYPATWLRSRVDDYLNSEVEKPVTGPATVRVRDGVTERFLPGAGWARDWS